MSHSTGTLRQRRSLPAATPHPLILPWASTSSVVAAGASLPPRVTNGAPRGEKPRAPRPLPASTALCFRTELRKAAKNAKATLAGARGPSSVRCPLSPSILGRRSRAAGVGLACERLLCTPGHLWSKWDLAAGVHILLRGGCVVVNPLGSSGSLSPCPLGLGCSPHPFAPSRRGFGCLRAARGQN